MLSNLLNTLSFGATIQSGGKPYNVILRLSDRLFVVVEPNQALPTQLMLCQADIQMKQPGQGADGVERKEAVQTPAPKAVQGPGSMARSGPLPGPAKDNPVEEKIPEGAPTRRKKHLNIIPKK